MLLQRLERAILLQRNHDRLDLARPEDHLMISDLSIERQGALTHAYEGTPRRNAGQYPGLSGHDISGKLERDEKVAYFLVSLVLTIRCRAATRRHVKPCSPAIDSSHAGSTGGNQPTGPMHVWA
jgi:hypothetical protein